jgi:uroporphyrinogen-III decarboxylase
MPEQKTPRSLVKALLRGEKPNRPLLMPIIFSLGSRLENLPLRDFQSNPTKIANALRQIRGVLKVDGLTCYYDPLLEAEALGCRVNWLPDGSRHLVRPPFSGLHELRQKLVSPESVSQKAHIRVVCDVLQRLKAMLKDEPALMVRVTGPFTLATQLTGSSPDDSQSAGDVMEFSAEVTATVAKEFVSAGADVVFLTEDSLPQLSGEFCERWTSLLEPVINMIRFYDALPVMHLGNTVQTSGEVSVLLDCNWNCVLSGRFSEAQAEAWASKGSHWGAALPAEVFLERQDRQNSTTSVCGKLLEPRPVFLTSLGDIPPDADLKPVAAALELLRGVCSAACGQDR